MSDITGESSVLLSRLCYFRNTVTLRPACFVLKVRGGNRETEPLEEFECDISGQSYSDEGIHSSLHGNAPVTGKGEGNSFKIY